MAQDVDHQGNEPEGLDETDSGQRSGAWPWVVLAIVVLIVILLLWWYWRQPQQKSVTVIKKTAEIPVAVPEPRPEPIVPTSTVETVEASTVARVPDVLGRPRSSAVRTLEGAGYAVTTSTMYSASKASGLVVSQNPGGGTPLDPGGTVAVVVSASTPTARDVKMPDVSGLSQSAAESRVKAAGLVPYITYGTGGTSGGHVISQWPPAGEMIPEGSEGFIQIRPGN
jgi:hypothetical protein